MLCPTPKSTCNEFSGGISRWQASEFKLEGYIYQHAEEQTSALSRMGRMVQWHDGRFGFEASPFRKELIAADTGSIPVVTPSFAITFVSCYC